MVMDIATIWSLGCMVAKYCDQVVADRLATELLATIIWSLNRFSDHFLDLATTFVVAKSALFCSG